MTVFEATDQGFVSEHHRRVAEIIADYDPHLRLAYIPESQRNVDDPMEKPFAVVDLRPGVPNYFVLFATEEELMSGNLLARLFTNDLAKVDVRARLKAEEDARQIMDMKRQMDRMEHAVDVARTLKRRSVS